MVYSLSDYIIEKSTNAIAIYRKPSLYVKSALNPEFLYKNPEGQDNIEESIFLSKIEQYFIIDNEDYQGLKQFLSTVVEWNKVKVDKLYKDYTVRTGNNYRDFYPIHK